MPKPGFAVEGKSVAVLGLERGQRVLVRMIEVVGVEISPDHIRTPIAPRTKSRLFRIPRIDLSDADLCPCRVLKATDLRPCRGQMNLFQVPVEISGFGCCGAEVANRYALGSLSFACSLNSATAALDNLLLSRAACRV
jgi:hypothetical protein